MFLAEDAEAGDEIETASIFANNKDNKRASEGLLRSSSQLSHIQRCRVFSKRVGPRIL